MKKLKLSMPAGKVEVLTREQLKFVMGGENGDDPCMSLNDPCYFFFNCCTGYKCDPETHLCKLVTGST